MSFAREVKFAVSEMTQEADRTWRKSVAELFNRVTVRTPRDTGAAQESWLAGFSNDGRVGVEFTTYAEADIPAIGSSYMLYSNLPYIERLEDGYSQQQPNGMVKTVIVEWPSIVKKYE